MHFLQRNKHHNLEKEHDPGQKKIRCDTVTEGSTLTRKDVELSL